MRSLRAGRIAALAAAVPLAGCAAVFGGHDLAPNGLPRAEEQLRHDLATRAPAAYRSITAGERELPEDDLLRLLYAGLAGRYAGAYDESTRLLDLASYLAEDRVTRSISREALSMITSDRALAYVPGRTERLMIPYIAAFDYLAAGNREGAAVEARRIESLLDRFDESVAPADLPPGSRFLHYFAATVFEAAGDRNAASVAYRRAGPLIGEVGPEPLPADSGEDSTGDVLVLVERGFVPHRVEQSVTVLIPPSRVACLTEGSAGEKAAAAAEAASRILFAATRIYGDRADFYDDDGFREDIEISHWHGECGHCSGDDCDEDDDEPYLMRIAWPVLYHDRRSAPRVRIRAGEYGSDAAVRFDVAHSAREDFEADRPTMLARTMLRAASKLALSTGAKEVVSKRDEAAGEIIGVLTELGMLFTERADTRSWQLLPGSVDMVRLRLPAGTHTLALEPAWPDNGARVVPLGPVEVRPGAIAFVATRLWP